MNAHRVTVKYKSHHYINMGDHADGAEVLSRELESKCSALHNHCRPSLRQLYSGSL